MAKAVARPPAVQPPPHDAPPAEEVADPVRFLLRMGDMLIGCFRRFQAARGEEIITRRAELVAAQDAVMRDVDYRDRDALFAACVTYLTGRSRCPFTQAEVVEHVGTLLDVLVCAGRYRPAVHVTELPGPAENRAKRVERYNFERNLFAHWDTPRRQLLLRLAACEDTSRLMSVDYAALPAAVPEFALCLVDTPASPATTPPTTTTPEKKPKKLNQEETNVAVRDWLLQHAEEARENPFAITRDRIAEEINTHGPYVSNAPAWILFRDNRDADRKPAERTVPLTDDMLVMIPDVGAVSPEVAELIRDQEAENESDDRRHRARNARRNYGEE